MTLRRLFVQLLGLEPVADKLRLEEAFLCVDCETLSPARGAACLGCGGIALLSLKRVLGGIRPEETTRLLEADNRWPRCTSRSLVSELRCQSPLEVAQRGGTGKMLESSRPRYLADLVPKKMRA